MKTVEYFCPKCGRCIGLRRYADRHTTNSSDYLASEEVEVFTRTEGICDYCNPEIKQERKEQSNE